MRTTLKIDDELLREAKIIAANTGKTIAEVFEDALRESLFRRKQSKPKERIVLPSFKGTGTLPGVNMDDWSSVKAFMDEEDAAALRRIDENHHQAG